MIAVRIVRRAAQAALRASKLLDGPLGRCVEVAAARLLWEVDFFERDKTKQENAK